jgi:hypothetical protein
MALMSRQGGCRGKSCMGDAIMRDPCSADMIGDQVCAVGSSGVARDASCAVMQADDAGWTAATAP